jgi:glycosyltransferase involved in cell wall biosynthesis
MRLALICDWYAPRRGGIEAHLKGLGSRLAAAGHDVHVITSTVGPSGDLDGVTVHRLDVPTMPWAGVAYRPSSIRAIGRVLDRERIEIAHAHVSIVAPVGIGGAAQAQAAQIPTVVTFHSFVPGTRVWAGLCGRTLHADDWRAAFTAVSSRVAGEVSTFAPSHRVAVLPNAIDVDYWSAGSASSPHPLSLVYVGRLQSKKRPLLVIEAARRLRASDPDLQFIVRIVGSGPLEAKMRELAAAYGLTDRVEFLGWKTEAEVRDILNASDIFLSPSTRESFGLAALEARCAGVPVIAMRRSAVADLIVDGESGLLAASDADFIQAVVHLSRDVELRSHLAAHNRRVKPHFDWDHTLELHAVVYARAMGLMAGSGT